MYGEFIYFSQVGQTISIFYLKELLFFFAWWTIYNNLIVTSFFNRANITCPPPNILQHICKHWFITHNQNHRSTPAKPKPIKVYPQAWQHEWIKKKLAADISKSAQTVKPIYDYIDIANMRCAEKQRATNGTYGQTLNIQRAIRRW